MAHVEQQPLLPEQRQHHNSRDQDDAGWSVSAFEQSYLSPARRQTRRFISSKWGHYAVLALVSLDVSCIFADFLISLYICDASCKRGGKVSKGFPRAQETLGIVSLVFSCLFMVELVATIWAFGLQ